MSLIRIWSYTKSFNTVPEFFVILMINADDYQVRFNPLRETIPASGVTISVNAFEGIP